MLELYEQNRPQSSHGNDEGSSASGVNCRASADVPVDAEETTLPSSGPPSTSTHSQPEQVQSELHSRNHGAHGIKAEGAVQDHWDHETGSSNPDEAGAEHRAEELAGGRTMMDAARKIDKDKAKAALEKRRRSRVDVPEKMNVMNEDEHIERELEHGVELAIEDERNKQKGHHSVPSRHLQSAGEGELSVCVEGQKRKAANHLQHYDAPPSKRQETY